MRTAFRYRTTQNVSILHEFTTLSFSTSNSFPRRVISSDVSHHKTLQHSDFRWLKCSSPALKKVGSVPKHLFLVTHVPRRLVVATKNSVRTQRIFHSADYFLSPLGKQPTCMHLGSKCAGHEMIVPRSKAVVNNVHVTDT